MPLGLLLAGDGLFLSGLALLLPLLDVTRNRDRIVVAAGVFALGVRYLVWRWADTMAWDLDSVLAFAWPLLFAVFETSRQFDALHAAVTMSLTTDRRPEADRHERALRRMDRAALPRVDVFIPTYSEPREVLYRTLIGAKALDYPNVRVFFLDDGARPWLREMCAREGVNYIERRNGKHAKAGNINNGLAMTRDADPAPFILMLDADFVPYRHFLWRTLGFFDDPKVAVVQTPQFFFNPDPVQMNLGSPVNWAEEQRFFFDSMQASKDAWDMSFCCGSSCVFRRAAIEAIGGVPIGAVIEDIHLSYVLMAHGWVTRYLNEILSNGMATETLGEFVGQRVRWAVGCVQALRLRFGPFGRNGLSLWQRIFYLSTIAYWINLVFVLFYIIAPPMYWLFGVSSYRASLAGLAVYQLPNTIASQVFLIWVGRGRIIPPIWEGVQTVFVLDVARAVYPTLLTGSHRATRATRKGLEVTRTTVDWRQVRHIIVLAALNIGALCWGLLGDDRGGAGDRDADQVNLFWSLNALAVLGIGAMLCVEQPRRRVEQRFAIGETILLADGTSAVLEDISVSGMLLRTPDPPAEIVLRWRDVPPVVATRIRADGATAAYRFEPGPETERALTVTLFTSGFAAQIGRIRFGSFLATVLGRLVMRAQA